MEKKLNDLSKGEKGVVTKIAAEGRIKRRLFDMGITPGAEVALRKVAPMGDPVEFIVRGYELSLRKSEAETVTVEVKA